MKRRLNIAVGVAMVAGICFGAAEAALYVTNGLVVHFDGIENAGAGVHDATTRTWTDLTGHGNTGTLGDNVTWVDTGWTNTKEGRPVTVGNGISAVTATKTFTLEFACSPQTDKARRAFVSQYDSSPTTGQAFGIEHNSGTYSGGYVRLYCAGSPDLKSDVHVAANEDVSVSVTVTPQELTAWKNGVRGSVPSFSGFYPLASNTPTVIGGEMSRASMAFRGTYHAFRLYNRVLSRDEIRINAALDAVRFRAADPATVDLPSGYGFNAATQLCATVKATATSGLVRFGTGTASTVCETNIPFQTAAAVTLTAVPDEGATFVGWSGDTEAITEGTSGTTTITVSAGTHPVQLVAAFRPGTQQLPPPSTYIQSGLQLHFDGRDNAGTGTHDALATTWTDLKTGAVGTLGAGVTWGDTGWVNAVDGKPVTLAAAGAGAGVCTTLAGKSFTIECAVTPTRDATRQCFFGQYSVGDFNIEQNSGSMKDHGVRVYYGASPDIYTSAAKGAALDANQFGRLSVVSSPTRQAVYTGGTLRNARNGSIDKTLRTGVDCIIGGENYRPTMAFYGTYHAFRLYNRPLTDAEVAYNAALDAARFGSTDLTIWKGAAGGSWLDGTNWTYGVPNVHVAALVSGSSDHTFEITSPLPAVTNLFVRGDGATMMLALNAGGRLDVARGTLSVGRGGVIAVNDGGEQRIDASVPDTAHVAVNAADGGVWRVNGGTVRIDNPTGIALQAAGTESATGAIEIVSGTVEATGAPDNTFLRVQAGGRFAMSGGAFNWTWSETNESKEAILNTGGLIDLSGTAALNTGTCFVQLRGGQTVLRGSARWTLPLVRYVNVAVPYETQKLILFPTDGKPCELTVADQAAIDLKGKFCYVNYNRADGTSVLNYNSSATFAPSETFAIGFNFGTGIVNQTTGRIEGGGYGIRIGQGSAAARAGARVTGVANVSGGTMIMVKGWQNQSTLQGLIVGAGVPTDLENPGFYEGYLNVSGGTVTNGAAALSYLGVGVGTAYGRVCQTGGVLANGSATYQTIIGAFGGTGEWCVSNGVSTSAGDVYVGGIPTNALPSGGSQLYTVAHVDAHSATGVLEVAGGAFRAAGALVAGTDGHATIRVGASGELTAACADLANTDLVFALGADGVGTFKVGGTASFGDDVTLCVDTSAFEGRSGTFRLLEATTLAGTPTIRQVGTGVLTRDAKGYLLTITTGTVLILR